MNIENKNFGLVQLIFFVRILFERLVIVCSEPVWPSDKAGKQRELGSKPLRLSFLFKSCGLWTRSCDFVPHI